MNPIVYFFSYENGIYSSYPKDYTQFVFKDFISRSKNDCQIILHRKDNVLHYGYIRRLADKKFFGICLCVDRVIFDFNKMFSAFDSVFAALVERAELLKLNGNYIVSRTSKPFADDAVAINEASKNLLENIGITEKNTEPLPPVDYSVSINDCIDISLQDSFSKIKRAVTQYGNVYIAKTNAQITKIDSFKAMLGEKNKEIAELNSKLRDIRNTNISLSTKLIKANAAKRNITWVALLGVIAIVLGVILWNKVLFPSEVTHYETGEFVYYGPIKDGVPHGIGVAIYPANDSDGRKYYVGNFNNGQRQDTASMLLYVNGDYFYGAMSGDEWEEGIVYKCSDNTYYKGTFYDNRPYNGEFYDHVKKHNVENGEVKY